MAFTYTLSVSTPAGTALANTLDTVIQQDKAALVERLLLEHNDLTSTATGATDPTNAAAQGRHIPGKVACVKIGTTVEIAALTSVVTGCIAWDTTLEHLKIYNGTNWTTYYAEIPTNKGILAFSAYPATAQALVAGNNTLAIDTESFDYGSCFAIATYRFTPTIAGLYQLFGAYSTSTTGFRYAGIAKNGTVIKWGPRIQADTISAGSIQTDVAGLVSANGTTDYFTLVASVSNACALVNDAAYSWFEGHLVSRS